jgi:hypothetical protein
MRLSSLIGCALWLCAGACFAQAIYKHVDEEGNVTYTDSPPDKSAEAIELPPINTQPAPIVTETNQRRSIDSSGPVVYQVRLLAPANDTAIPAGQRSFKVSAEIQPQPRFRPLYQLIMNGETAQSGSSPNFTVNEPFRGSHSVKIIMLDENNTYVAESESIIVHVIRPTL